MKLGLIAQQRSQTNLALAGSRAHRGEIVLLRPAQALLELHPGDAAIGRLDVLRSMDGIEPGIWVLDELERRGVVVLNSTAVLANCHDKLATARLLEAAGIPHPHTGYLAHGLPLPELSLPLIVKPRLGSWGRDVSLCTSDRELADCLTAIRSKLWFVAAGAVVQEVVPPLGYDLRVLIACGQLLGAIRRVAAAGEWRTNISLGGRREQTWVPHDAAELALAAADALGGDLVGVDLLPQDES